MLHATLGAVTIVAALGVSGCSPDPAQPSSAPAFPETDGFGPTAATAADPGPLPPPEALSDVITRLADPAVPGTDKLGLVEGSSGADAAAFDSFAAALRDNGFTPVTVRASDIVAGRPGGVLATIKLTGPDSESSGGTFSFPMEFRRAGSGWQLTRQTAEMLLAFSNARTAVPAPPPSPAPPP